MTFWKKILSWLTGDNKEPSERRIPPPLPSLPKAEAPAPKPARPKKSSWQLSSQKKVEKETKDQKGKRTKKKPATPSTRKSQPVPTEAETPSASSRPSSPRKRTRQEPAPIIIGLDFGTHSTKTMLRTRGNPTADVLNLEQSTAGYPWFAVPSLVRLDKGCLFFGKTAAESDEGVSYRSLKVQLLISRINREVGARSRSEPTPDLLVACYLSWILGQIGKVIAARHPHGLPPVFLNMAAPMNHFEDEALKTRYLHIIQAAWESVFGASPCAVQQGATLRELRGKLQPLLKKGVPDRTTRRFEVLPETVAPIVSLSLDPRMSPGMYMIVDMGAGTTELSVNHVDERGADQRVLCYHDESVVIGGDNFGRLDALDGDKQAETQRLMKCFRTVFARTWHTGYMKDRPNPATHDRWRRFQVLLAGGATRRPEVEQIIKDRRPFAGFPVAEEQYDVTWHRPTGLALEDGPGHSDGQHAFLAVAHGLSVPRQQWPEFFTPDDVTPQTPLDDGDDYRDPYWYLER